jgi:dephospho-CoA kinase
VIVLGLTGGVGMGKSTAAGMLRRMRVPVHDADAAVHRLLAKGGAAVAPVAHAFPEALRGGAIDRQVLGARVFADPADLKRLEGIVHPLVRRDQVAFLRRQRARRAPLAVLDIPLLFETGGQRRCDAVLTMTAAPFLQHQRVLRRLGMTEAKFKGMLARQMPDYRRRRDADFVVSSGLDRGITYRHLRRIVDFLHRRES